MPSLTATRKLMMTQSVTVIMPMSDWLVKVQILNKSTRRLRYIVSMRKKMAKERKNCYVFFTWQRLSTTTRLYSSTSCLHWLHFFISPTHLSNISIPTQQILWWWSITIIFLLLRFSTWTSWLLNLTTPLTTVWNTSMGSTGGIVYSSCRLHILVLNSTGIISNLNALLRLCYAIVSATI